MMYHCMLMGCWSSFYTPKRFNKYPTARAAPCSTKYRYTAKKATVASTTPVVAITSSRLGQVTFFISTRVSCRNVLVFSIVPPTLRVSSEPVPPCDSSFIFAACVAMLPFPIAKLSVAPPISGRGGGIRTPIPGFGDRSPNRWTTPLNSTGRTYLASLCAVCFRHVLQNFLVSSRSECFFLFLVVV